MRVKAKFIAIVVIDNIFDHLLEDDLLIFCFRAERVYTKYCGNSLLQLGVARLVWRKSKQLDDGESLGISASLCARLPPSFDHNSALLNRDVCAFLCIMNGGPENHQVTDGPYYNVTQTSQTGDKRKSEDDGPPESDKKTKRNRYISIAWWAPHRMNKN